MRHIGFYMYISVYQIGDFEKALAEHGARLEVLVWEKSISVSFRTGFGAKPVSPRGGSMTKKVWWETLAFLCAEVGLRWQVFRLFLTQRLSRTAALLCAALLVSSQPALAQFTQQAQKWAGTSSAYGTDHLG